MAEGRERAQMDLRVLATSGLVALVLLPGASAGPGATARVSVAGNGAQADSHSLLPAIDGAGRIVAFYSDATNLVPGDTNNARDVFARDRQAGTTVRVSVDSAGAQANGQSFAPAVSRDGRLVAFHSDASNLVPGDANNASDVFVHDRQSRRDDAGQRRDRRRRGKRQQLRAGAERGRPLRHLRLGRDQPGHRRHELRT